MLFGPPMNNIMSVSTTTWAVIGYYLINVMIVIFETVDIGITVIKVTYAVGTAVVVRIINPVIFCPRITPVSF
jgi:hypothetical protein